MGKNLFVGLLYGKFKKGQIDKLDDVNVIELSDSLIYVWGRTDIETSNEVVHYLSNKYFSDLKQYDISIDTEDKIFINEEKLTKLKTSQGLKYLQIRFVGKDFDELVEDWKNKAFCIREAENVFGLRSIKIDLFE